MDLQSARQIIDTLAQGIHPVTGQVMPEDSPYNAPPVIRALFVVSRALEDPVKRPRAPNAGKPWTQQDDQELERRFTPGMDLRPLAQELGRSFFAVEARLVKLGKLTEGVDVLFGRVRVA